VQLVWSLDGELTVTMDAPVRRRAALIPADAPHSFDATGQRVAILFVDPHGAQGVALDRCARADPGAEIAGALSEMGFPTLGLTTDGAVQWCDAAIRTLAAVEERTTLSSISRRAIAYIESTIDGKPQLAEAAHRASVSPTRLTHVFTREVGIPFRRFVLWTRLKHAVAATQG